MKHLVLNTKINETTVDKVANLLVNESKLTVAVCNTKLNLKIIK